MMRVLTAAMGMTIGKDVGSVMVRDNADPAAGIAWQAGMSGRVQVSGADFVADRKGGTGHAAAQVRSRLS